MVEVVKVMKWFTILTSFCYVCGEKIVSLAYLGRKFLNMLMLVWKNVFDYAYVCPENFFDLWNNLYDLVKIL
jgi:hypothetical protein